MSENKGLKRPLDKPAEVAFLTEEFGIPAIKAAALVSQNPQVAERLAEGEMRRQHARDPLAGDPVPQPPKQDTYPAPAFGSIKPIKVDNDRTGAG
ncbi:hypothetical protein SAMN05216456_2847 [Devosia crocina]|uniref:Uncharacterized protein n=1 Tax=Devosia crocina TaxID=429728 RepID=A0A1I7NRM7_9HYPH|nr:hypothetical protein [Devosia crocina]SFV37293.1 hypothetical protein SAMN05216456_2847 [Devosia crocina]